MPFTINGIGTKLYGARDFAPNGSYITTEWFSVVYVPIFPIKSLRILPMGSGLNVIVYARSRYAILERPGMNWKQVGSVYGWFAVVLGSMDAAFVFNAWWLAIPGVLALAASKILRSMAIKRMRQAYGRSQSAPLPVATVEGEAGRG